MRRARATGRDVRRDVYPGGVLDGARLKPHRRRDGKPRKPRKPIPGAKWSIARSRFLEMAKILKTTASRVFVEDEDDE